MQLTFLAWEWGVSGVDVKFERSSAVALWGEDCMLFVTRPARGRKIIRLPLCGPLRDSSGSVEIVSAPGTPQGWLDRPGACLVVCAEDAAKLEIGLRRSSPTGTLDASFQMDNLGTGKAEEEAANAGAGSMTSSTPREPAAQQRANREGEGGAGSCVG